MCRGYLLLTILINCQYKVALTSLYSTKATRARREMILIEKGVMSRLELPANWIVSIQSRSTPDIPVCNKGWGLFAKSKDYVGIYKNGMHPNSCFTIEWLIAYQILLHVGARVHESYRNPNYRSRKEWEMCYWFITKFLYQYLLFALYHTSRRQTSVHFKKFKW